MIRRKVAAYLVAVTVAVVIPANACAGNVQHQLPPKILVLRGVFEVFSLGMNDLARKLRCRGYDAEATSWSLALLEVNCSDQRPIVVVGHSLGGRMCGWVPRKLKNCGKQVPLVIVVDANLIQSIPGNVDRCLNLYVTNPFGILHGSPVRGESARTNIVNWDVSQGQPSCLEGGVNHFNIDATDWVHDIIIREIDSHFAPRPASLLSAVPQVPREEISIAMVEPVKTAEGTTSHREPAARQRGERVPWQPTRTPYYGSEPPQAVHEPAARQRGERVPWQPTRTPYYGSEPPQAVHLRR